MREKILDWAMLIVAAEEAARLAAKPAERLEVKPASTRIKRLRMVSIPATLIDESGTGVLRELLLKSKTKDYTLTVRVDGSEAYKNSWSWFKDISQEFEGVDAFEEDGVYVLHLSGLSFRESLKVTVKPTTTTPTILEEVLWKIDS